MHTDTLIGMKLGTFTLKRLIRQGDREAIFLAQQSHLHQVAVKVLLPMQHLAPDQYAAFLERFLRETDVIASLEHPNIMPIYEHGESNGLAYLVMPHIDGHTLHDEIRRDGPLPLEKVVFYLERIAAALDCAHDHGVVHRNIQPANIFLSHKGDLWLNGFGLEKVIPRRDNASLPPTRDGGEMEELDYIAPEQITGDSVDMRTDQYALGVLLYQMVTGLVPFKGDFPLQVLMQHLNTQPPSPRLLRPDLPPISEQVLLKALAKRPEHRYMYIRNFAHAFCQAFIVSGTSSTGFSKMSADNLLDLVMQTPHSAASSQQREVSTEKQSAIKPAPPTAHLNRNRGTSDIVARTSLKLPSMAGLVELAAAHLNGGRDRNNIVESTSLGLPSMSDLVEPSLPSPAVESKRELAAPTREMGKEVASPPLPALPTMEQGWNLPGIAEDIKEADAQSIPLLPTTEPHIYSVQARQYTGASSYPENIATETHIHSVQVRPYMEVSLYPENIITETQIQAVQVRQHLEVSLYPENIITETHIHSVQVRQPEEFDAQPAAVPTDKKTVGRTARLIKRVSLRSSVLTVLFVLLVSGALAGIYATTIGSANRSLLLHEQIPNGYQDSHPAPGTRSFRVGTQPFIEIKGHSSNVNIHTGSAGIISVKTTNHGSQQGLKPDNTGIQYYQSRDGQGNDHISIAAEPAHSNVDYDVTVPSAAQVQVEVNSGSVTIDGVSGVTIDTNGGNLDIEDVQGPVDVHTENGDITVRNVKGQMTVEGGSGSIKVNNVNGQLNAVTRNGDVIVRGATLSGQSALKTTNGSVRFEGAIDSKGTYMMETNRGDVDLTLPADAAFQLHASTASGSIHNEFAGNVVGNMPQAQITVSIGSGGSVIVSKA